MCSLIDILQWKKNQRDSDDFWHRKLTLKVKFWYFLTAPHYSNFQNMVISFEYSWFLPKNLPNFVSLPWKLHNRECHTAINKYLSSCCKIRGSLLLRSVSLLLLYYYHPACSRRNFVKDTGRRRSVATTNAMSFFLVSGLSVKILFILLLGTGCVRQNENHANFKIVKKPLLVRIQTIPQQKALDLSFNLAPWKWAWPYQEAATPSRPTIPFFTPRAPMLFAARGRGTLLILPRPLLGCQMKAEIQGFLLMYSLFLY